MLPRENVYFSSIQQVEKVVQVSLELLADGARRYLNTVVGVDQETLHRRGPKAFSKCEGVCLL